MKRELTCVACPLGCTITVELNENEVISVTGNTCKRGEAYAKTEITNPTRSLTSTVKVNGGILPVVPVKSDKPVPKDKMFECMKIINSASVDAPVKIGQVIIENILDTGADIVATNID
ncbi:MAG: DUF1667 domain-containing protein [Ruminococcaceae bacterium]|nr:DUF1667 domain-containing protein [Oscillospiraceae bacterium]